MSEVKGARHSQRGINRGRDVRDRDRDPQAADAAKIFRHDRLQDLLGRRENQQHHRREVESERDQILHKETPP